MRLLAMLFLMLALLAACSSSASKETVPTRNVPLRSVTESNKLAYLNGVRQTSKVDAPDGALISIGLIMCNQLDEGADFNYVGNHNMSLIKAIGGDQKDEATVAASAIVNLCPQYLALLQGGKSK